MVSGAMTEYPSAEYWRWLAEAERRHGGPLVSDRTKLEMVGLDEEMAKIVLLGCTCPPENNVADTGHVPQCPLW